MKRITLLCLLLLGGFITLSAQDTPETLPDYSSSSIANDHAWEIGFHGGHAFTAGNVDFTPGYGAGIHIRRALDYVFSLRLDLLYAQPKGEDEGNVRSFTNTWMSGSFQIMANLNNLKWDLGERKTGLYAFGGFGLNSFEAELMVNDQPTVNIDTDVAPHADLGAGIAFKINPTVNIGIEHKATLVMGNRSDKLDGAETIKLEERSTFRDVFNYTSVRINFNLLGKGTKTEPLYWLNPLDGVLADVQRLKDTRVTLNDSDMDGVIDMMDEEENSPAEALVNAKGITLDSDGDGIADHMDKEPYSQAGFEINEEGIAQKPDVMAEVEKMLDEKLRNFEPASTPAQSNTGNASAWFLPAIYFNDNSSTISYDDYATLANIAEAMKANPNMKFVVIGHADMAGSEDYNNQLSYNRAKAVVDHLTQKGTVDRGQLILNWKGETENLVEGRFEVNRRVQLKVATSETEMSAPASTGIGGN